MSPSKTFPLRSPSQSLGRPPSIASESVTTKKKRSVLGLGRGPLQLLHMAFREVHRRDGSISSSDPLVLPHKRRLKAMLDFRKVVAVTIHAEKDAVDLS